MPSLRWPAGDWPKPAMMRPRTGQRNVVPLAEGPSPSSTFAFEFNDACVAGIWPGPATAGDAVDFAGAGATGGLLSFGSGPFDASWVGAGVGIGGTTLAAAVDADGADNDRSEEHTSE